MRSVVHANWSTITDLVDDRLALWLSKNETKHNYHEGAEEGLLVRFAEMVAKNDSSVRTSKTDLSGVEAKQYEMISLDYIKEVLSKFSTARGQYTEHVLFKFNTFYKDMMSPYGGVSHPALPRPFC